MDEPAFGDPVLVTSAETDAAAADESESVAVSAEEGEASGSTLSGAWSSGRDEAVAERDTGACRRPLRQRKWRRPLRRCERPPPEEGFSRETWVSAQSTGRLRNAMMCGGKQGLVHRRC